MGERISLGSGQELIIEEGVVTLRVQVMDERNLSLTYCFDPKSAAVLLDAKSDEPELFQISVKMLAVMLEYNLALVNIVFFGLLFGKDYEHKKKIHDLFEEAINTTFNDVMELLK